MRRIRSTSGQKTKNRCAHAQRAGRCSRARAGRCYLPAANERGAWSIDTWTCSRGPPTQTAESDSDSRCSKPAEDGDRRQRRRRRGGGAHRGGCGADGLAGVAPPLGHRHAHRHRHAQPLRRQLRHHRLRRPPRQPPPRRRLHRPLRLQHLLSRIPPGHGERAGDAVRAGVRRRRGGHAGRLPAALLDRPRRRLAPHGALLRARRAAAAGHRPGRGRGARGGAVRAPHPARRPLLRRQLPHRQVPAGAEQGAGARLGRRRGARLPRRAHLPPRRRPRLGPPRRRRRLRRLALGHRARPGRLHRRLVHRRLAGLVRGRVPRHVGLRPALARVRRHALPRDLVHRHDHRPHRPPPGRPDRRRLPRHLHECERMGGHDLHRPQCGHQRPSLQRAGLRPAKGGEARGHGRRRGVAAHRAAVHGPRAHLQRQLLRHLHQRLGAPARRLQDRGAARPDHGAQQRAARAFRGRHWRRMARPCCVHQPGMLLHLRAAPRLSSRLQVQLWSWGDLGRHALRDCTSDTDSNLHRVENGLERRGCAGFKPCAEVGRWRCNQATSLGIELDHHDQYKLCFPQEREKHIPRPCDADVKFRTSLAAICKMVILMPSFSSLPF